MTTKYKIISGFFFMILLLAGLAVFGYQRLNNASEGFNAYRAEARTSVSANWADALMREAKSKINAFIINLDPAVADQARRDLDGSIKYTEQTIKEEPNSENRRRLSEQVTNLRKMSELSELVKNNLRQVDQMISSKMGPAGADVTQRMSSIHDTASGINNIPMLKELDNAYKVFANLRVTVRLYCDTYDEKDGIRVFSLLNDLSKGLDEIEKHILREEARKAFGVLRASFNTYAECIKDGDKAIKESNRARAQLDSVATGIAAFFDKYTAEAQENMNKLGAATRSQNDEAQRLMATGSAIGVVLGLLFAIWIIIGVVRVLTSVSSFAVDISKGDFNSTLNVREGGEIGNMVKAIQAIPATLKDMVAEYHHLEKRVEEGYLDVQGNAAKFSGEYASIVQGANNILKRMGLIFNNIPSPMVVLNKDLKASYLNRVAQDLAGSDYSGKTCKDLFGREDYGSNSCSLTNAVRSGQISSAETVAHPRGKRLDIKYTAIPMQDAQGKLASVIQFIVDLTQIKDTERKIVEVAGQAMESADRVAAASEQLAAQVEQGSRGAEMQRSRVESTATAMSEMNSTVLEVARNAGHASEQSDDTRKRAENGADLVNKVVRAINEVNTVAMAMQKNMLELGQQAESIGGVMNVISDIADQTNLLALNAAIEAARAGEAGRGFAVVADELRKLAEKTMEATREVGANIQAIQSSARTNIDEMGNAAKGVQSATELANASGNALNEIVTLAASSSSVVASIATAAEEQSATSEEINHALEEVSRIVAETTQGMTQASAAVQDLSATAQELKRIMERLRR